MTRRYETQTGRGVDLSSLGSEETDVLRRILSEYETGPDWSSFSTFWQRETRALRMGVPAEERTRYPLYVVAQDLEMRLGVAQGAVAPPDYRDYLFDHIREKFGSRYRFCKETGISEAFVSQVLSGRKDFSLPTLRRVAEALGLGLVLLPLDEFDVLSEPERLALRRVT